MIFRKFSIFKHDDVCSPGRETYAPGFCISVIWQQSV